MSDIPQARKLLKQIQTDLNAVSALVEDALTLMRRQSPSPRLKREDKKLTAAEVRAEERRWIRRG